MKIALIAHDRKKPLMIKLTTAYKAILEKHELFATGTTGGKIIITAFILKFKVLSNGS